MRLDQITGEKITLSRPRFIQVSRLALVNTVLALALLAPCSGRAEDPKLDTKAQQAAPTAFAAEEPKHVLHWGVGDGKSLFVPAYEIIGFEFALNRFNHYVIDEQVYGYPTSNLRQNLHHSWVTDNDKYSTNQFLHPYQGSIYQGFARSAGLSFWESFGYTMAGSLLWEQAGETTFPSINDQVASGIGGNFLGEPLFRIASLLLESGGSGGIGYWREWEAAAISPSTGFNRLVYGNRFAGVFRSHDPAVFTRIDLGASLRTHFSSNVNVNAADPSAPTAPQRVQRRVASADITMGYGLPGKPGYTYERPFDYFNFEFTTATRDVFENVFSRGLLYGTRYEAGDNYRGIWGLYGTYDYVAPQIFRVSSTAVSLGSTAQWWLSDIIALQGTVLAGVGYGGGGAIHGSGVTQAGPNGDGLRDYHYGVIPQEMLTLRLILGDRVSLDTTARNYYISSTGSTDPGSETITRADVTLTVRVYNLHGITLKYADSTRNGRYPNLPNSSQKVGTFMIGYALLGQTRFGAVDWRPKSAGGP